MMMKINKPLNVFFAVGKSFIQHFTVAATSLLENNKDLLINIYVINDKLDKADLNLIIPFFKEKYDVILIFLDVSHIDFSMFRMTPQYSKYTYFRLFLAHIAPEDIETALFLDSDIIVTGSIVELAQIQPQNKFIYAVSEVAVESNTKRLNSLGFNLQTYFNAGVMLVNLTALRAEESVKDFIAIATKFGSQLEWVDQDILNIHFANRWEKLDRKFNAIHLIRRLPTPPLIIHYNTFSKPWFYVDTHPYNFLYWYYLKLTPFRNRGAVGFSLKNLIFKNGRLIKRGLREAGILSYKISQDK